MKKYLVATLGCKVNQCESASIAHDLDTMGGKQVSCGNDADLIIINTCAVTGKAAMQSRQAIRKAIRNHPRAAIVVTGCYAQTAPAEIKAIKGVGLIVGHQEKLHIAQHLSRQPSVKPSCLTIHSNIFHMPGFGALSSAAPQGRTRAFLKIQDGCDTMCTYCIVPYARGRSKSMPIADVLDHINRLHALGYNETVLTGIHLGAYGADLTPPAALSGMVQMIIDATAMPRLRLSSIEPTEIDDQLLKLMTHKDKRLCDHLHIPLQSGDNNVLERMRRPYSREDFAEVILAVRRALPWAAIGTDVLVGFPGEDEKAFEQTHDLIAALPLTYLHVFPFSPRKGTPAAGFGNKVPERTTKKRCELLRALGQEKKKAFLRNLIGCKLRVLIQSVDETDSRLCTGLSDNYIPVVMKNMKGTPTNSFVMARINALYGDEALSGVL